MSTDSKSEEQSVDIGRAATVIAFADSGPFDPASAIAIRALAMQAHEMDAHAPRGKCAEKWDDTGESLVRQEKTESHI
jgi:hypothetical protein